MKTLRLAVIASGLFAVANASAADLLLFNFTPEADLAKFDWSPTEARFRPSDARITKSPAGMRVATGHEQSWPGITLPAPNGHWDLAPYANVSLIIRNPGSDSVTVVCRVDNPGADGISNCVSHSLALQPGQSGTLMVPLKRFSDDTLGGKLFGMRGYPARPGGTNTVNPTNITRLLVFVEKPRADRVFEISTVSAAGTFTPPTACVADADPFFPFIDTFGQYRHKDWPGKAQSVEDLAARREQEAQELAREPGPKDWDRFGGSATGPQLKVTGFFRTEKVDGKWWLVDPDGHLFFSNGIDSVRTSVETPIEERENWFADFPGRQPEFAAFLSQAWVLKGHYQGRTVQCFSFGRANLLRKYGPGWQAAYPQVIRRRLRSWGINTLGNWSDESICLLRLTPYTDTIGTGHARKLEGSSGYWGKFLDPFDPALPDLLRGDMDAKKGKSIGDPWCLGYFSDNEMSWGDDLSLATAALQSPPDQPAKQAFLADLKSKYTDVPKLNQTWGTAFASWDSLLQSREAPDKEKARPDLAAFYTRIAEQYFRTVRDAIKAAAPNQLYLGCRFAWVNARAAAAAAKYCDVVSYNIYHRSVVDSQFNGGADVPLLIGEFHFGALDRGLFHPGLVPVPNQEARAQAYKDYVLGALRHPQFVGCHWFEYRDEPVTGRVYDEENYQIGFVDVADTPYSETIAACRDVGYNLYQRH